MAKAQGTVWDLEPHTAKKHEILRRYLEAWLPIMSKWHGRILYVDGFAGPGEYSQGEPGSPVIALKAARDHRHPISSQLHCVFIEAALDRFRHLEKVLTQLLPTLPKNITYRAIRGTFSETFPQVFALLQEQQRRTAPTFVFIDPFGFSHTPFAIVGKILENPKCEVLITLIYEEINRFLSHPDHPDTFDSLLGTNRWREVVSTQIPSERLRLIHDIYLQHLKTKAKYVRSFQMLNDGNRIDYLLFFATNGIRGLEKMKESMWRVDASGGTQFSDYTDSSAQLLLIQKEPDYGLLRELIVKQFGGRQVEITELEEWVTAETPFLPTHLRRKVLIPMEQAGEVAVQDGSKGRRRGSFPKGTVLQFR